MTNDDKMPFYPLVQGDTIQDIQQLFKGFSLPVRVDKLVRTIKQWRDQAVRDRGQSATGRDEVEVEPQEENETGAKPEIGSGDEQQTESGNDGAKVKSEKFVDVRTDCWGVAGDIFYSWPCPVSSLLTTADRGCV